MPPGQVSRGQRATDLRSLGGSSKRKRSAFFSGNSKDQSSKPTNSESSSSDSGSGSNSSSGNHDSSSGNNKSGDNDSNSDNGSNGSNGGSQDQSHTSQALQPVSTTAPPPFSSSSPTGPPPPPPCFGFCVPDNDPRVKYSPNWSIKSQGFFSTSHATDVSGSWVTLNFTGSAITVFGSIPASNSSNPGPTAAYSIDAAKPFVTAQPMASQEIHFQPLFSASQLSSDTMHQITINVTDVQSGAPFTLDYFILAPSMPQSSSTSPSATAPAASGLDAKGTSSKTANPFNQGGTGTTVAIAVVLGTVIFVLIVMLVLFLVVLPMRRKRSRREGLGSNKSSLFTTPESILRWSRAPSSSPRHSITSHFFNKTRTASEKTRSVPY